MPTGGYLTITGQAGQGKSSIIAKLVEKYAPDQTAHHLIPFNPGSDYQVSLLRDIMTQLILKHDLPDLYVADASRSALRDYFPMVLKQVMAKGKQEVIFIDGLDQLREEMDGERDLSFLPNNLPEGVVFVLGARPNDTLRPLELRKPHRRYDLPNLSRQDFDLILEHRKVKLDTLLADQFYQAMQANALYLDLVAKELAQEEADTPEEIIKRVADNPEHLFTLSMDRLGRSRRDDSLWNRVLKPILGVLLVAREPLAGQHIRTIIDVDADRLNEGLRRLGGLITDDGRQCYSLYHLKLYDYLRQDESNPGKEYIFATDEMQGWHKTMADWCEQNDISVVWEDVKHSLMEQGRREYARRHYIEHLYHARKWQRLFNMLDEGTYGGAKMRYYDYSASSYAQDLKLGQQAAAWEGWALEEGVALLPHLWRYILLRCSLINQADSYTPWAFEALLLLKRDWEALARAELLTKADYKAEVLLRIAKQMEPQLNREQKLVGLLTRTYEVAKSIEDGATRARALVQLVIALAQAQQWEQAEAVGSEAETVIRSIKDIDTRAWMLRNLVEGITQAQQWERAEAVAYSIEEGDKRAEALGILGVTLAQAQQWERAEAVAYSIEDNRIRANTLGELAQVLLQIRQWERAEALVRSSTPVSWSGFKALGKLAQALAHAQQWEQAESLAHSIENSEIRAQALSELAHALAKAQQWEQANAAWEEAEAIAGTIEYDSTRARTLAELAKSLAQAQQWERAERVALSIEKRWWYRAETLCWLVGELAKTSQWERAKIFWEEAALSASSLEDGPTRATQLGKLAKALTQAQQQSDYLWTQAAAAANSIRKRGGEERYDSDHALGELVEMSIQVQQWEQARAMAHSIEDTWIRGIALCGLGKALAQAQQQDQAEVVWNEVLSTHFFTDSEIRAKALSELEKALAQAQQTKQPETAARPVEKNVTQAHPMSELARALVQARQWEQAEVVALSIEKNWSKDQALGELAEALARAQQWEQAERVAHSIERNWFKAQALNELARELTQARQRERAEVTWREAEAASLSIKDNIFRLEVFCELAETLDQMQRWDQAEAMWKAAESTVLSMESIWKRASMLRYLAKGLARVGRHKQLLHLVQRSWLQTNTREAAIKLLPVVSELIPFKPDISTAFCEVFTWVDTFLKG